MSPSTPLKPITGRSNQPLILTSNSTMATLSNTILSLPPPKLLLTHENQQKGNNLCWTPYPPEKRFRICACSIKKPRPRRGKSNVELCYDIREFVSAVGLPAGHVPSFKELQDHGRNDLANIVRRRGYRVLRELLSDSTEADIDGSSEEKILAEGQDAISDGVNVPTGKNAKLKNVDVVQDGSALSEVHVIGNNFGSMDIGPDCNSGGDCSLEPPGSSISSLVDRKGSYHVHQEDEEVTNQYAGRTPLKDFEQQDERVGEGNSLSIPFNHVEQGNKDALSMVVNDSASAESSSVNKNFDSSNVYSESLANFSSGEEVLCDLKGQDVSAITMEEEIPPTVVSDAAAGLNFGDHGGMSMDSTTSSSLEEKVARFIQGGDLDAIDDDICDVLNESATSGSQGFREPENITEIQLNTVPEQKIKQAILQSKVSLASNERLPGSIQVTPPVTVYEPLRNDNVSAEGVANKNVDEDLVVEAGQRGNQADISHLKFMLHQKELELSRLKEQIEKEKLALSALQTKAEADISKARKLISEKDAELLAVEENLSGLVEVNIQYYGDGEIVEVAGSFNGWHHPIKLDPQQSSTIMDTVGSRNPRVWSTMLWLYPGVYEMKFIVDGHWVVDPQRESVNRGGIHNNILRVDG